MSQRLFITIGSHHSRDRILLEMPRGEAIQTLLPELLQVLGWKEFEDAPPANLELETEDGLALPKDRPLQELGVINSDTLFCVVKKDARPAVAKEHRQSDNSTEIATYPPKANAPDAGAQDFLRLVSQPHFQIPTGVIFLIGNPPVSIGRAGNGFTPNIDLSEWDTRMIASRKHAVLEKHGAEFRLVAQKTTNGTFINGVEITAGESHPLQDGDRVQCGFQGLELTFRSPANSG